MRDLAKNQDTVLATTQTSLQWARGLIYNQHIKHEKYQHGASLVDYLARMQAK